MKCKIIIDKGCEEAVYVYLRQPSPIGDKIKALAEEDRPPLIGYCEKAVVPLRPEEILYVSIEDGKVLAVTDKETLRLQERLYQLEGILGDSFVRIHQSCLANIRKIERFDASLSGSLIVIFKNGDREYVSRRQLKTVKERMGFHL